MPFGESAFATLPERYLGADPGFDGTYHIKLTDLGHTWEVRCKVQSARVRKGAPRRRPDVTICTDAETWLALRQGELSGIDAFMERRLSVHGNLDYAVGFEGVDKVVTLASPRDEIRIYGARRPEAVGDPQCQAVHQDQP